MMLKNMGNATDSNYAGMKVLYYHITTYDICHGQVSLLLTRRWFYHAVSVFLQSVLLLVVAYTTFYYRVDNFQERIMVTITCMLVVANVQSSVGDMIPKTSYFKMIDYFLLYSLNIIIIIMVYHTYMTAHIQEDFAPNEDDLEVERIKSIAQERLSSGSRSASKSKSNFVNKFLTEGGEPVDKLADANRINKQGQIFFVVGFVLFQVVFWSVALAEFIPEKKIGILTDVAEYQEMVNKMKI